MNTPITVTYRACDGFAKRRTFKTLAGARRFAIYYLGEHPEFGHDYAVSPDGIGTITVEGATLRELFAKPEQATGEGANTEDYPDDYQFGGMREYDGFHSPGHYGDEEHQAFGDEWYYRDCPGAW